MVASRIVTTFSLSLKKHSNVTPFLEKKSPLHDQNFRRNRAMNDRWPKIDELFHAALELKPDERAAFLDHSCNGDQVLRDEIESLLTNVATPVDIIDSLPVVDAIHLLAEDEASLGGHVIQHYQILTRIGEGGMGQVYAALDQRLNRNVALKFLPSSLIKDEEQVRRLHNEARAASALNHPNIVTIYELGQEDSLHFIAMEFVDGETLREKPTPVSFRDVLNIAIQVASGLAAAHEAGILHRDIKPENIMAGNDGYVKILDFGISKFKENQALSATKSIVSSEATLAAGTVSYMSPEQARRESLDARTDIFSLGVVLFELVAGQRPFSGESRADTMLMLLNDETPSLNSFRKNVPVDLERIISKALSKDRDKRYQSAKEMLADLREFDRVAGRELDEKQRANRMLRQYLSIYAVDKRALIPLTKLASIRRYSDLSKGERTRDLLAKSLRIGILKMSLLLLLVVVFAATIAAYLSVDERWDEVILKDGHTRAVRQTAFSPDGNLLVSVGEDSRVIAWDFAKRMPLATFSDHTETVTSVAFSPDGKWFATGGEDGKVIVWSVGNLSRKMVLSDRGKVVAVTFSSDGQILASLSNESAVNGHVTLWKMGDWNHPKELVARIGSFGELMFANHDRWLISSGGQKWDLLTGEQLVPDFVSETNWMAVSPNGSHVVLMGGGNSVGYLDLITHKTREYLGVHQDTGRAAAYSPDGRYLATGSDDVILWDAQTMTKLARFEYPAIVWHVTFSPDGHWLVSTHGDGAIVIWDVSDRRQVANLNSHGGAVRSVAWSPDGKSIASASEDRSVVLWNADSGKKQTVLLGAPTRLTGVAFSHDGKRIAASSFGTKVLVWEQSGGSQLAIDAQAAAYCVAFSPDNRWVATTIGVFNANDGHMVVDFPKVVGPVGVQMYGVAFSPDGHWLVGASPFKVLSLIDTETWKLHDQITVSDSQFVTLSFSPDGRHFVTGDDEGTVRLWDIEALRQVCLIGRHSSRIKSVAFSPDGKEVCSAGDDQSIALWDVNGRRLITRIGTHASPVLAVAFSPDGQRIVSGEHDSTVRVYSRHRTLWGWEWN